MVSLRFCSEHLNFKYVAAFWVWPIQGEARYVLFRSLVRLIRPSHWLMTRIVVPESGYLARAHQLPKQHHVLLACDRDPNGEY